MKIGDKVMTKQIGMPTTGTICAMWTAETHCILHGVNPHTDRQSWTDVYPDWFNKNVIMIKLDTPHKPTSLAKYIKQSDSDMSEADLKVLYKYTVPITSSVLNPEDDVEIIE